MRSLSPRNKASSAQLAPWGEFPFSLSRMREELDRMFERVAREYSGLEGVGAEGWRWGLEVEDRDENILVKAEAPGFEPGDFDLRVEDGRMILRATKKIETKDDKGRVKEVREQSYSESFTLPAGIDKNKVDATYHNGVLTVTLPKTAESKPKKIAVTAD